MYGYSSEQETNAQYISQIIKKQYEMKKKGETVDKEFIIPDYLKDAVYCVTER